MKLVVSLLSIVVSGAACGGTKAQVEAEKEPFLCRDRIASYMATKHISGDEIGVQMDCKDAGPRIKRWRTDKLGNRQEDAHPVTPFEFDKVWKEIDGTGWPNLHDCANGSLEKSDPVYVFDIKDDQNTASFQCQTRTMPYPYNDLTDPLDLLAQQGRKQLGDDEPAEAKALDKKDKQR
ncbi:MAG: hypothetical protein ABI678_26690 [Kofleriaceae bacterium]